MKLAFLGLGSRGLEVYVRHLTKYRDVEVTGLCDINPKAIEYAQKWFSVKNAQTFLSEDEFFAAGKIADALVIATLDQDHYRQAIKALNLGYNLLLEKPVSNSASEIEEIAELAKEKGLKVLVCHVLRYAPFYRKIKDIIASGEIGEVVSITHQENIGYWHFSHSYCRGNWRNSDTTAPMLLAKCCHDFDLFQWFIDKPCKSVSSYGDLSFFTKKNQPEGAANSCLDNCKYYDTCPYSVNKIYLQLKGALHYSMRQVTDITLPTPKQYQNALRTNNYGKCVFATDNNVCDHQVVNMEFEGGATVAMGVCAFSKDCFRNIHVHGTKGEIIGKDVDNKFVVNIFGAKSRTVKAKIAGKGHLGGDIGICETFHKIMNNEQIDDNYMTTIDVTLLSHEAVFAAEKSRLTGKTVLL